MIKKEKSKNKVSKSSLKKRTPVVVILGHVDHGKSSILEAIKDFKITEKESGGITQHVGAYEIEYNNEKITFIDTPGHEAFSSMRCRGAEIADIVILVIAAEEGIKPQTKEVISYIKKINIPTIVAINKVDKIEANPEKIKRELADNDILVESMNGKVPSINVSAKTKKGITELLDMILLISEMQDLKADYSIPACGVVIESHLDKQRGSSSVLLLREGMLKKNDIIATPTSYGRIKILENFQGDLIDKALASQPVIVLGLQGLPIVGEKFEVFSSMELAKNSLKIEKQEVEAFSCDKEKRILNLIIKTDVSGSIEAIQQVLSKISQEEVGLRILRHSVGDICQVDVELAKSLQAIIVGFRVKTDRIALKLAQREKISIRDFNIIYELKQYVDDRMKSIIKSKIVRLEIGRVDVLEIFRTEKKRQIIGGKVTKGEIKKGVLIEVFRAEEQIGKGRLISLQRDKKEIDKISKGQQCGILFQGDVEVEQGDLLVIYTETRTKKEI